MVAPSCSLLHVPLDLAAERGLDPQVPALAGVRPAEGGRDGRAGPRAGRRRERDGRRARREPCRLHSRAASPITSDPAVRSRAAAVTGADLRRASPYAVRAKAQRDALDLPPLPTTTIGSFPQTAELRRARARLGRGELDRPGYDALMRAEIDRVIGLQESIGLDVLVHGEPERNDMVQYFAEQLDRLPGHRSRLGPVVRQPVRAAADHRR